ncbi:hypothetical protein GCM10009630_52290 [Kribbella jejuensis]
MPDRHSTEECQHRKNRPGPGQHQIARPLAASRHGCNRLTNTRRRRHAGLLPNRRTLTTSRRLYGGLGLYWSRGLYADGRGLYWSLGLYADGRGLYWGRGLHSGGLVRRSGCLELRFWGLRHLHAPFAVERS